MKTVRRLIYLHTAKYILMISAGFAALALFIDFVDEMLRVGKNGYTIKDALIACGIQQGQHLYDLLPISLLIGSILALARLAQTSEFTILRTSGLSPARALKMLGGIGLVFAATLFLVGEFLVPWSEQALSLHRAKVNSTQALKLGREGVWLREKQLDPQGHPITVTINIGEAAGNNQFRYVRIFQFNQHGQLERRISANTADISTNTSQNPKGSIWLLRGVNDTEWVNQELLSEEAVFSANKLVKEVQRETLSWNSSLTPILVEAAVLPPDSMSVFSLWRYTTHLAQNAQAGQRHEIELWKKIFYPLVCMVMVALALPFAYLHARGGGMSLKIFGGIMLGISFVLVNHISGHLGLLHQWRPWIAAVAPSLVYLLMSLSAFIWLVRYR